MCVKCLVDTLKGVSIFALERSFAFLARRLILGALITRAFDVDLEFDKREDIGSTLSGATSSSAPGGGVLTLIPGAATYSKTVISISLFLLICWLLLSSDWEQGLLNAE